MSRRIIILLTVAFCTGLSIAGDLELETPHITVLGTAEVKVTPNEMNWHINVSTRDKELPPVAAKHTETVAKALEFLKSLKIDEDKLQTSSMQFGEEWEYTNRKRIRVGYLASTNISFTISDFDLYQKIWFGLAQIDGVSIQNTQYAHSDRIKYQNESRQKAGKAAREKAEALAQTLGRKITHPLAIEEITAPQVYNSNTMMFANIAANSMDNYAEEANRDMLALGKLTISTTVRVTFMLAN